MRFFTVNGLSERVLPADLEVWPIRNAQQGYFSIQNRDNFSPEFKKIRVVTTIQHFLVDG